MLFPQAEQARNYGLYALSITEDTVRIAAASQPSRDLFKEFAHHNGVAVAVMSPQMMGGDRVNKLMQLTGFQTLVRWVLIDESHLVDEQGSTFIVPYKALASWRSRLGSKTVWGAFTGTASRSRTPHIAKALGFVSGEYVYTRYPIDRPNIKYIPRFFDHPFTGESLLDFTFLIPFDMTSPQAIIKTLVFTKTIEYGDRVIRFLDYIIALRFPHLPDRNKIIMPYNSLMSPEYRTQFAQDFRDGDSVMRIGVVTDTCTYGLDMSNVRRVVVADMDRTPENLKQTMGRAGRDGQKAVAIAFAPPWARRPPDGATLTGKQAQKDAKRREALPLFTQRFYNPSQTLCPRRADLEHYGDEFDPAVPCLCAQHSPQPEQTADATCVQLWVEYLTTQDTTPRALSLRSDGTYPPLDAPMKASLTAMLNTWTIQQWVPFHRKSNISELMPVACFCPRYILERLVEKAHVCTTMERLGMVMDGWKHLATHGEPLFLWLTVILKEWKDIHGECRESLAVGVDSRNEADSEDEDEDEAVSDGVAEEHSTAIRSTTPPAITVTTINGGATSIRPRVLLRLPNPVSPPTSPPKRASSSQLVLKSPAKRRRRSRNVGKENEVQDVMEF